MNKRENASYRISVSLSEWMNKCYSVYSCDGDFEHLMNFFSRALCSLDGIYGAWIFQKIRLKRGYDLVASYNPDFHIDETAVSGLFRKNFSTNLASWKLTSRPVGFAGIPQSSIDEKCRVLLLPGLYQYGEIILTLIADTGLIKLLSGILPGMFQNILEFAKVRYGNIDSEYRSIVESQNELIVKVDSEGRFMYVSPTYCKLFGMTAPDLVGRKFLPLIHPDDRESTMNAMEQLKVHPHQCYFEQRARTVIGWRWLLWSDRAILDNNGRIVSVVGTGRDITEQKKTEQELFENENKFQKAFRSSPNLMAISRLSDGLLYDVNDKFAGFLQMQRNDILGKKATELGLFRSVSRDVLKSLLIHKGRIDGFEIVLTSGKGQETPGLFSAEIIELNGEKCMVSSFQDITELRKVQAELEMYQLHLEGLVEQRTARIQEINDELERFADSVAHDLKAPLRVIQGYINALTQDHATDLGTEALLYCQRIGIGTSQMENLINDLLQYSKLSSLDLILSEIDTGKALHKALNLLSDEINDKQAIISISKGLPKVLAYLPVLVQVFTNLISNSLKFVDKETIPKISVSGIQKQEKVLIRFKDNGIGIQKDKQKRIFEVFERLHGVESYPGTGIGLTIVKKAVERMGGSIKVSSSPGKGSTFQIELRAV